MAQVSGITLIMAVQAVDAAIGQLTAEVAAEDGEELPDMQELLLSYYKAASELEEAYKEEQAKASNLPAYEKLIRYNT